MKDTLEAEELCLDINTTNYKAHRTNSETKGGEDYIKIAFHNINGVKTDNTKIDSLLDIAEEKGLDIIGLCETNIQDREGHWLIKEEETYRGFWASADKEKKKGSGVAIIMHQRIEKHLARINRWSPYIIEANFVFKREVWCLFVIYIPPNNREIEKEICKKLLNRIDQVQKKQETKVLIMGDFNVTDKDCRATSSTQSIEPNRKLLIQKLKDRDYENTFVQLEPDKERYTRRGVKNDSEIDYIWLSKNWQDNLRKCKIQDMSLSTRSDHHMIIVWLQRRNREDSQSRAQRKRAKHKRICVDIDKIEEQDWKKFAKKVDEILKTKRTKKIINSNNESKETQVVRTQKEIDEEWDIIEQSIRLASNKTLPKKRVVAKKMLEETDDDLSYLRKISQRINRICRRAKKKQGFEIDEDEREELQILQEALENDLVNGIWAEEIIWTSSLYRQLENWAKTVKEAWSKSKKTIEEGRIREFIEDRCEKIVSNQKQMLNSILEKPYKRIKIDRVVEETEESYRLFNTEKEVLNRVETHFKSQFRERIFNQENMKEVWQEQYKPKDNIREEWFEQVSEKITVAEWDLALSTTRSNSAPGCSGITYPVLKHIGADTKEACIDLMTKCLKSGQIPIKWKIGMLYPIPKKEDWNYNLNNVHPILLLETVRKVLSKIIMLRLGPIFRERKILKGPNYAGLMGESTEDPIHILNCITEEAREKKKETWILLQDMQKAFDSVSMVSLELALRRIRLPENICRYIVNMYKHRQFEIITAYGNTDQIKAGDGIDQGEVLSPLVWRIFYDPLLCEVQSRTNWGYTVEVSWPTDLSRNKTQKISSRQSVIAYADDTTWIAKSKEELVEILNLADDFYELNDIKINKKKSELVVINGKKDTENQNLLLICKDGTEIKAKVKDEAARFLGIWISEKNGKNCSIKLIEEEVQNITRVMRRKKVSLGHLQYINNKVLIPRVEYRLKCHIISKQLCEKLHRPMIMLIKNKAGLAKSTANGIMHHRNMIGIRTIWQARLAQQIPSLIERLNNIELTGHITWIRLRQAQLDNKSTVSLTKWDEHRGKNSKLKYNFNAKLLLEARSLGIGIECSEIEDDLKLVERPKREIWALLDNNEKKSFIQNKNSHLYVCEQLVNRNGRALLTWPQIQKLRGLSGCGKKPAWFKRVEEVMIENKESRAVKSEFVVEGINSLILKPDLLAISEDRRKQEWVLFEKNKETEIGRVKDKRGKSIEIEHWIREKKNDDETLVKCTGCSETNLGTNENCLYKKGMNRSKRALRKGVIKKKEENKFISRIPLEMLDLTQANRIENIPNIALEAQIHIDSQEIQIIKKYITTQSYKVKLGEIAQGLSAKKRLSIYTDGALETAESDLYPRKMGIGWIIINEQNSDEPTVLRQFKGAIKDWPSSTRAELGAIGTALLVVPYKCRIKVYTDSANAIGMIQKIQSSQKKPKATKLKNGSILAMISNIILEKKLEIELIKVKSHSGIYFNEQADKLAKEGARLDEILEWRIEWSKILKVIPRWNQYIVDVPIREMVDNITNMFYSIEWLQTSNIEYIEGRQVLDKEIDWKEVWGNIRRNTGHYCRSMKNSREWVFDTKCLNELLPTLNILNQRRPDLYLDDICIACHKEKEDIGHLARCDIYEVLWNKIEKKAAELAIEKQQAAEKISKRKSIPLRSRTETLVGHTATQKRTNRLNCIRGLFYKQVGTSKEEECLRKRYLHFLRKDFKEIIWTFRCKVVNEWEKENGILTKEKKKKKGKRKNSNKKKQKKPVRKLQSDREIKEAKIWKKVEKHMYGFLQCNIKPAWSGLYRPRTRKLT